MAVENTGILVSIVNTNKATLSNTAINNGFIYFVGDTKELYFDYAGVRNDVSSIITVETEQEKSEIVAPINKLYLVKENNTLYYYNNGEWHSVSSTTTGNFITQEQLEDYFSKNATSITVRNWLEDVE